MTTEIETTSTKSTEYQPLTPKLAWQLAAPHTWPASIMPIAVATAAAYATNGSVSFSMSVTLLVICVLMQSAVNTFNDYFDYVKGTDSEADNVEVSDAVLVYNNVNPKSAKHLAIGMLVIAFILGIYPIYIAGWIPLAFGLVGALIVVLYSGGKTPISYLPLGEAVSGVVMGGLIPIASYHVLSGVLDPLMIIWSIPTIIGIGLIMLTNNTCDIEKDIVAERNTLPVVLGRGKSVKLYHALVICWIIAIVAIVGLWFTGGLIVMPFMLLSIYPLVKALFSNPIIPQSRVGAMAQICSLNIALGAFYVAGMMACNVCLTL
ncbi:MAG: prenyltransferase [Eggerthellaceae bacterium]|nr:prenyltransferase [Eggerthellaceae bacterium]